MRAFISVILAALFVGSSATGEDLIVRSLSLNAAPMPELFVDTKDGFKLLEFSPVEPTEPLKVPSEGPLNVFSAVPEKDEKAQPAHRIPVPNSPGVLILGWMVGDEPKFAALPDNVEAAGPRDWLMINAAQEPILLQIGKDTKPFVVRPGTSVTQRVALPEEDAAEFRAFRDEKGKPRMFYSTFMPHKNEVRCVLLFYPDGKNIRLKQMFDMNTGKKKDKG